MKSTAMKKYNEKLKTNENNQYSADPFKPKTSNYYF